MKKYQLELTEKEIDSVARLVYFSVDDAKRNNFKGEVVEADKQIWDKIKQIYSKTKEIEKESYCIEYGCREIYREEFKLFKELLKQKEKEIDKYKDALDKCVDIGMKKEKNRVD